MIINYIYVIAGLFFLVWSADYFVESSAALATRLGVPSLLIGMIIVGFGTSAPELLVSGISATQGNPGIAIGNAYGSNICNLGLILGITAILKPITVESDILKKELPVLTFCTLVSIFLVLDGHLQRGDAAILLLLFCSLIVWSILEEKATAGDPLETAVNRTLPRSDKSMGQNIFQLLLGLIILMISSKLLVTGAVEIAKSFGVSDLIIGLTIVAVGTSLPELASSISAIRKNEHDLAIGNVIGSNLFNTLMVVGIAAMIEPIQVARQVLFRDLSVVFAMTLSIFVFGYGFFRKPGRINRFEGIALVIGYIAYLIFLIIEI